MLAGAGAEVAALVSAAAARGAVGGRFGGGRASSGHEVEAAVRCWGVGVTSLCVAASVMSAALAASRVVTLTSTSLVCSCWLSTSWVLVLMLA